MKAAFSTLGLALSLWVNTANAARHDPDIAGLNQRLAVLQAMPDAAQTSCYGYTMARQAIDALQDGSKHEHDILLEIAKARVEIAELQAKAVTLQRQYDQLNATRNSLLIESSRRQAEQAQMLAEQLQSQLKTQTQEAQKAQEVAEAAMLARETAEKALNTVANKQQAKLSTAQKKALSLAHQEAELTTGSQLPPSHLDTHGELFTFATSTFDSNGISSSSSSAIKTLAKYLEIRSKGMVEIRGYGSSTADGANRGQALSKALQSEGIPASRLKVSSRKGHADSRAAEVVVPATP